MRKWIVVSILLLVSNFVFGQNCNCKSSFEWMKKTFEENDAGYQYVIDSKGIQSYLELNTRILKKVKTAKTSDECALFLNEWLSFFRPGYRHIGIWVLNPAEKSKSNIQKTFPKPETFAVDIASFEEYLNNKKELGYEGIWTFNSYNHYKIGIKKEGNQYIGFIIESDTNAWPKNQVKLRFEQNAEKTKSTFYMADYSAVESDNVKLVGDNILQIGDMELFRIASPNKENSKQLERFFKFVRSSKPYMEELNDSTLYFRIPSFRVENKKDIDSLISSNRTKILKTENLIIDIRNGTGGSDNSFEEIIPFIYTNPIRTVGVEHLSTKLNNQIMLRLAQSYYYECSEEEKKWYEEVYAKLEQHLGEFVNLNDGTVQIEKQDTIYEYPKNVGIIINSENASTDEQFLLTAKQSKKVKLFGTTTYGVLDISNMNVVESPCKEFELGYCRSRSFRIPEFTIDSKGIQPDFYLDKNIPEYKWVQHVSDILNGK